MKHLLGLFVISLAACQLSTEEWVRCPQSPVEWVRKSDGCLESSTSHTRKAIDASIEYCWQEQSKKSWDPDTARQMALVCEKLETERNAIK